MYKVSFYTHRVAVLIAESMMLMLSLDVLSLSLIGICHVGSTGFGTLGILEGGSVCGGKLVWMLVMLAYIDGGGGS